MSDNEADGDDGGEDGLDVDYGEDTGQADGDGDDDADPDANKPTVSGDDSDELPVEEEEADAEAEAEPEGNDPDYELDGQADGRPSQMRIDLDADGGGEAAAAVSATAAGFDQKRPDAAAASASASASAAAAVVSKRLLPASAHELGQNRLRAEAEMRTTSIRVQEEMARRKLTPEEVQHRLRQIGHNILDLRVHEEGRYGDPMANRAESAAAAAVPLSEDLTRRPQVDTLLAILDESIPPTHLQTQTMGLIDDPLLVSKAIMAGGIPAPPWEAAHIQRLYAQAGTHVLTARFRAGGGGTDRKQSEEENARPRTFVPCNNGKDCVFLRQALPGVTQDMRTQPFMAYLTPDEYDAFVITGREPANWKLRACIMCIIKKVSMKVQLIQGEKTNSHRCELLATALFCVKVNEVGGFYGQYCYAATLSNRRASGLLGPILNGHTRSMDGQRDEHGRVFMNLDKMRYGDATKFGTAPTTVSMEITREHLQQLAEEREAALRRLRELDQKLREHQASETLAALGATAAGAGPSPSVSSSVAAAKKQLAAQAGTVAMAEMREMVATRMAVSSTVAATAATAAAPANGPVARLNF